LDAASFQAPPESSAFLKERLRRAIAALEPRDAEMFTLRYVEGLSNGEIAEIFGVLKARVAMRLYKIRLALQAEMER
jgi:RNA polymerase sigma factor (sigma-70 family)